MNALKLFVSAVIVGVAITLITGVLQNTPAMLVGAVWYGYPLAWLVRMVVAPSYNPWVLRPLRLGVDLVFWIIIAAILIFAYIHLWKK